MTCFVTTTIRAQVTRDARSFRLDDAAGVMWKRGNETRYVAVRADGTPSCGRSRGPSGSGDTDKPYLPESGSLDDVDLSALLEGDLLPMDARCLDPDVMAVVDRFCASLDTDAVMALLGNVVPPSAHAYAFVTGGTGKDARAWLCRRHPWAVTVLAHAGADGAVAKGREMSTDDVLPQACVAASGGVLTLARAKELVVDLEHDSLPDDVTDELPSLLALVGRMPKGALLLRDGSPAQARSLLCLAYLEASHAAATGRGPTAPRTYRDQDHLAVLADLLARAGGTTDLYGKVEERADGSTVAEDDEDVVDPLVDAMDDLLTRIDDMVGAFEDQVVVPALVEADPGCKELLAARTDGGRRGYRGSAVLIDDRLDTRATAFRLLARDKSTAGFLGVVRDWHGRQDAFAVATAPVTCGIRWPAAFAPWTAPNGLTVRCLVSGQELIDEGVLMENCVGGYVGACAAGASTVVSVRDTAGPVATLELRFRDGLVVAQVRGPRNAEPETRARMAVSALISALRDGTLVPTLHSGPDGGTSPERDRFTFVGHFARLREAWDRYLPRDLRGSGPAALLASVRETGATARTA